MSVDLLTAEFGACGGLDGQGGPFYVPPWQ